MRLWKNLLIGYYIIFTFPPSSSHFPIPNLDNTHKIEFHGTLPRSQKIEQLFPNNSWKMFTPVHFYTRKSVTISSPPTFSSKHRLNRLFITLAVLWYLIRVFNLSPSHGPKQNIKHAVGSTTDQPKMFDGFYGWYEVWRLTKPNKLLA